MPSVVRLLVIALFAAGCALVEAPAAGPLVTVEATGGMCLEGKCRSVIAIEADGRSTRSNRSRRRSSGATSEAIEFSGRRWPSPTSSRSGRGRSRECPTAFDGQELVYTVATRAGPERIASCEVEIDPEAPLFTAINAILGADLRVP